MQHSKSLSLSLSVYMLIAGYYPSSCIMYFHAFRFTMKDDARTQVCRSCAILLKHVIISGLHVCMKNPPALECDGSNYFSAFHELRQQVRDFLKCDLFFFSFKLSWVRLFRQPVPSLHLAGCHGYSKSPALAEWHLLFNSY